MEVKNDYTMHLFAVPLSRAMTTKDSLVALVRTCFKPKFLVVHLGQVETKFVVEGSGFAKQFLSRKCTSCLRSSPWACKEFSVIKSKYFMRNYMLLT